MRLIQSSTGNLKQRPICDDHVPIDISRFVFYSLAGDCPYNVRTTDTKAYYSFIGGLKKGAMSRGISYIAQEQRSVFGNENDDS